jgi:hypothetical protein
MKFIAIGFILLSTTSYSQTQIIQWQKDKLLPNKVSMSLERINGNEAVRVVKDSTIKEVDEPTFVKLTDTDFKNGIIEVNVLSRLLKNATETARGFIGIAFRINAQNTAFENMYIRPTNGRAESQLRRNRATQYFSFPDFKFDRLRKEAPGEYESYADMALNEWIHLRIEVNGKQAKLYVNHSKQPVLLVNDLKLGADASGGIGLWVDVGTEGFFSDLKVTKR